jgi:hypothetical protein
MEQANPLTQLMHVLMSLLEDLPDYLPFAPGLKALIHLLHHF